MHECEVNLERIRENVRAASEIDQLRAQVEALTAEVKRLKEPVGLVWQSDGGVLRSQNFSWGRYEVKTRYWGGFYPILCTAKTEEWILTGGSANAGSEDAAIAACAAHHAARYREMQAKPEPKDTP